MISEHEIEILSQLARIDLKPDEKHSLHHDLESILGYISQLSELGDEKKNQQDLGLVKNVTRDDVVLDDPSAAVLLKEVPHKKDDFVMVKKILTGTD
ncbi:MAG: Asp-tRNA(Asn)/Glu-tRNA(Gln) amidotransferase subunit GatC [Candidatus Paceibacterota bacterium]